WYRRTAAYRVISAKQEETRQRRLAQLISDSEGGLSIKELRRPKGGCTLCSLFRESMLSSARRFGFDRRTGIFRLALRAQSKPRANRIGNGSQNGSCEEQFAQAFAVPTLSGAWRKQLVIFSPPVVTVRGVSVALHAFCSGDVPRHQQQHEHEECRSHPAGGSAL